MSAYISPPDFDDEDVNDILRASERFTVIQDSPNEAVIKLHANFDDNTHHLHTIDSVLALLHQALEDGLSITLTRRPS